MPRKGVKAMKLMTKELEKRFAKVGSQENVKDPVVIARFFNPSGAENWYATEYEPKDKMFFGYVSIFGDWNDEWGYFSLNELESFRGWLDLGLERDFYWDEAPASTVIKK